MPGKLHIYSQESWHAEAMLVGDEQALRDLRDAINQALEEGNSACSGFTIDGEGYTTFVKKLPEGDEDWNGLMLPYTDEIAKDNNGSCPYDLIDKENFVELNEKAWKKYE